MALKELTAFIVKRLADKPEKVSVEEFKDGDAVVLDIVLDEGDKGKVIGKQGKVIKAIRAVVDAAAQKAGTRAKVKLD